MRVSKLRNRELCNLLEFNNIGSHMSTMDAWAWKGKFPEKIPKETSYETLQACTQNWCNLILWNGLLEWACLTAISYVACYCWACSCSQQMDVHTNCTWFQHTCTHAYGNKRADTSVGTVVTDIPRSSICINYYYVCTNNYCMWWRCHACKCKLSSTNATCDDEQEKDILGELYGSQDRK